MVGITNQAHSMTDISVAYHHDLEREGTSLEFLCGMHLILNAAAGTRPEFPHCGWCYVVLFEETSAFTPASLHILNACKL